MAALGMSTWDRHTPIEDPRIPAGFEVVACELRGYDSPDKWHEVRHNGKVVQTFGRGPRERERAILAAAAAQPKTRYQRLMDDDDQVPEDS